MANLVTESVPRTMFKMAFPMLAGTFAMNAYNLADTWFVAQIGDDSRPLAAMSFTLPVVMILSCLAIGLGGGVTALMSHALGAGDRVKAARFTTHGLLLVIALSLTICVGGSCTITPVFTLLNAKPDIIPLIGEYMVIWYLGIIFMAVPMLGNNILIACGDSKSAARLMMIGTLINVILDPLFIFTFKMGLQGAAIATVIGQSVSAVWVVYQLVHKHKLVLYRGAVLQDFGDSVKRIVRLGIPSVISQIMVPVSMFVLTAVIGTYGEKAVAATGTAGRLEMFFFVIPMALGISLAPFVSQNMGAGRLDRVRQAIKIASIFAVSYGAAIALVFYALAPQLAGLFTDDAKVVEVLVQYIRIICFGYGMMEVNRYCTIILMGLHKAMSSMIVNGIRVFVLMIPLVLLGSHLGGLRGIFWGRLSSDLAAGVIGFVWVMVVCSKMMRQGAAQPVHAEETPEDIALIESAEEIASNESARLLVDYRNEE